jgi:hypothetical protein
VAKKKNQTSIIGLIVVAILLGGGIALAMSHSPGEGGTVAEKPTEYDDSWGKLETPVSEAKVTHILVSWAGKSDRTKPKDPRRTKEQAKELIERLWKEQLDDPSEEKWKQLQAEHNEDTAPHNEYTCKSEGAGLDPEFNKCGLSTKVGSARYVESSFGYHLIRRKS